VKAKTLLNKKKIFCDKKQLCAIFKFKTASSM